MSAAHIPVMLPEVLAALKPAAGEVYVDATLGAGGYSRAVLEAASCHVFGIDRDPNVAEFAAKLSAEFAGRFAWLVGNFADMCQLLAEQGVERVDGIVLDLGVSSMQLDQPERGFSFRNNGPLDMRMGAHGMSAADFLNTADEAEIADVIYLYGEERASRRIAKAIVAARAEKPLETTLELAALVKKVVGYAGDKDPATRTFQALRMHVNEELSSITLALQAAEVLLKPGGRLVVVTFHSLEDRMVKQFTHSRCGKLEGSSRHMPLSESASPPTFVLHKPEKIKASDAEARANSRSRSATLRAATRTAAPARGAA